RMGADPNTIKRFLTNDGNEKIVVSDTELSVDQKKWLGLIKENPDMSVKQLRCFQSMSMTLNLNNFANIFVSHGSNYITTKA
ncbi:hypothetical protein, partial [Schinkia azotoformans]|uniref:hypothetical protein n=1 Tax=Schinkia azotoformans TaxID=1454 RepID=UPI002E1AF14C|nr:hypothetical protein [Schinkia azotoformans]